MLDDLRIGENFIKLVSALSHKTYSQLVLLIADRSFELEAVINIHH